MPLIWIIIIGFVAGVIVRAMLPRLQGTTMAGITGALAAAYLEKLMGWHAVGTRAGLFAPIVGAVLILIIYQLAAKCAEMIRARLEPSDGARFRADSPDEDVVFRAMRVKNGMRNTQ